MVRCKQRSVANKTHSRRTARVDDLDGGLLGGRAETDLGAEGVRVLAAARG